MKKSMLMVLLAILSASLFMTTAVVLADDIPHTVNYQGMLTDDQGNPLTGTYNITFKIYNHATSGTLRWEETHGAVPVTDGLFDVILGTGAPMAMDFTEEYWLDITVDGQHLSERLKFNSVPYAFRAETADVALQVVGVPAGDLDARYVNVEGPETMTSTSGDNTLEIINNANTDAISTSAPYSGAGDGMVVDTAGDNGIEIHRTGDDAVWIDNCWSNGVFMSDVAGTGLYVLDVEKDGLYLDDITQIGIHINDTEEEAIYIDDPVRDAIFISSVNRRGITIDSSGASYHAIHVDHAGVDGVNISAADTYGINATGDSGNRLASNSASSYALAARSYSSSSGNAGLRVYGYGSITGTWSTKMDEKDGGSEAFMVTSPDVEIISSGSGMLVGGKAEVDFGPEFAQAISPELPIRVVITAQGAPSALLYVDQKTAQGFTVQPLDIPELKLSTDGVTFDWIAIGRMRGYEQRPDHSAADLAAEESLRTSLEEQQRYDEVRRQEMLKQADRTAEIHEEEETNP